jgi:hypothetical protein
LPSSGGFLEKNFIEKDFDFLAQKYEKKRFSSFSPIFFYTVSAQTCGFFALFGVFGHDEHESN